MCAECGRDHGHATPCPNNPDCALDEPEMVVCEICGEEKPDEECVSGVCRECLSKAATYDNAMDYGAARKTAVEINGYLAYEFSADQIAEILERELADAYLTGYASTFGYLSDDRSDFADWLKERKKGGG